jgi:hypothetical protein
MASPFLFGPSNYAATGSILSATVTDPNYPATFILDPTRPFLPWRTTTVEGLQQVAIDLGAAHSIGLIAVLHINYPYLRVFGDNDPAFGSPDWDSGLTAVGQNPWNERYGAFYRLVPPVAARYWIVRIETNATTDGQPYHTTGGVYIGPATALPAETDAFPGGLEWDEEHTTDESVIDQQAAGGGRQRLRVGPPKTILNYTRIAHVNSANPGTSDGLAAWRAIDIAMRDRAFLWALNYGNASEAWMMRKTSPSTWPISFPVSRSPMVLEECIGP